eukprot:Sspe_Gene.37539::Locus_18119_Transcript_1_3_Confidence_0.625_Length_2473::g.37539::m.37539/K01897/ACSL, fadD; long-chain acyl-CoA synthetase
MAGPALQAVGALLVTLDFLLWVILLGPIKTLLTLMNRKSIRAKKVRDYDCNKGLPPSPVFRCVESIRAGKLTEEPLPGVRTLYEFAQQAVKKHASKNALGSRNLLEVKVIEGSKFPTKFFGETRWLTYAEVGQQITNFGSGLRALGLEPLHLKEGQKFEEVKGNHTILMYEDTCAEWFISCQGALSQSVVVATAYATLGVDAVVGAVEEAHVSLIVCNYHSVKKILERLDEMPSLKHIVYTNLNVPPAERQELPATSSRVGIHSFEEVLEKGREAKNAPTPPSPDDMAILMYTSGSTGKPKGVMVRHRQIVSLLGAVGDRAHLGEGEVLVGYLPMAHIFEMQMEFYVFGMGGQIGYADPKTLVAGPGKCMPTGALETFRPTVMGAVPKVWETIKSGAEVKISKGGAAKAFLFNLALKTRSAALYRGMDTPLFNLLVFSKFKSILGGRLKLAISGGGAIAGPVQEWVRTVFGCPLIQGYGLTETCAGLTVQNPDDLRLGIVGPAVASVEMTLLSEPEICDANGKPYLATDTVSADGQPILGRGEVLARGPNITSGYYRMPEATAEAFQEDGWFHTGDIGQIFPDGTLKIIDRKKNLVKLKGGEYIALEKMNQAYLASPFVDVDAGGVCSYGDGDMDRPVILVQCKHSELIEAGKRLGINSDKPQELAKNEKIYEEVMKTLQECAKKAKLSSLEVVVAAALLTEPWSPDNGTLTATLKIAPKTIAKVNQKELDEVKPKGIR